MEKPYFKVGETVITRGYKTRVTKIEVVFLYQTEECAPKEPWQESELRKVSKRKQRARRAP